MTTANTEAVGDWMKEINMTQLLQSEKYRLEIAIKHSGSKKTACFLLGISRWTYARWIKKYNVEGH